VWAALAIVTVVLQSKPERFRYWRGTRRGTALRGTSSYESEAGVPIRGDRSSFRSWH
jgi:hypothetical protein